MPMAPLLKRTVGLLVVCAAVVVPIHEATASALDDYVGAPDPHFAFDLVSTLPGSGYAAYVIEVTSQQWRSDSEVNRTLWKHWLTINSATSTGTP